MINVSAPVTKGCSGILLLPKEESKRREMHDCIRCAKCVSVCSMGLEPYLLMNLTEHKLWEEAEKTRILNCLDCGSCSYICPANRPVLDYVRLGKATVRGIISARKNERK
jgi:electron transport complex protein RnfC